MSAKGQVVIPKSTRDRLGLRPGDQLDVVETANGVLLQRPDDRPRLTMKEAEARLRANYRHVGPPVTFKEMDEAVARMFAEGGTGD